VLYGVGALDPSTFGLVALVIAAVGALACRVPAVDSPADRPVVERLDAVSPATVAAAGAIRSAGRAIDRGSAAG
jgi:hypothetical protein